jgi:UDP-N-acetylglucosamine 2-epimerase (non-hydrolysing)
MNRQLTDRLCEYCFAPTEAAKNNLLQEKIGALIPVTGNTVIDALLMAVDIIKTRPELEREITDELMNKGYKPVAGKRYILVTGHRRENFGEGFLHICKALKEIALNHPDVDIVYPVHLNPNVQKPVYELLAKVNNIYLIDPLNYLPFVYMMQHCYLILTDSGGVQEEAPSLGRPVLVMRDTTERPEAVEAGTVKLVGTDVAKITENVNRLLSDERIYTKMAQAHNPYGDGQAVEKIIKVFY